MSNFDGSKSKRPNVLWMNVDHIAYRQYRDFFKKKHPLRNLERLAQEGLTFDRAYSVCPLCCPARASMVTGLYPHHHGITQNGNLSQRQDLETPALVFSGELKKLGYRVGYFGKWHVGGNHKNALDYGFEGFSMPGYGNPYRSEAYQHYLERYNLPDPIVQVEWSVKGGKTQAFNMKENTSFAGVSSNGYRSASAGVFEGPAEVHEAFFLADMACQWLDERKEEEQPFLLRLDVWGPHQPYNVGHPYHHLIQPQEIEKFPNFDCDYSDRTYYHQSYREFSIERTGLSTWEDWQPVVARAYEHMIQVDAALGRVIDKLESTGLSNDTIVILTADHGDALAVAGGLFDKGALMIEETMSIPMVVKWPGVIEPGTRNASLVMNMDLVPTVIELCGGDPAKEMDGKSLMPIFCGRAHDVREDLMCQHHGHDINIFQRLIYYKGYKYVAHLEDKDELYDLMNDPYELTNRIEDPALTEVLKDLRERLRSNMALFKDDSIESRQLLEKIGF